MESGCVFYINKLRILLQSLPLSSSLYPFSQILFPFSSTFLSLRLSVSHACSFDLQLASIPCFEHLSLENPYLSPDSLNHWKLGLLHMVLKGLAWNFYQITLCDYTHGTHSKTMVAELNNMCTVNLFHVITQLCYLNSPEICKDHC